MNSNSFDSKLDRLLAQPPQMTDRGFSDTVLKRLKRAEQRKVGVFSIMCTLWLLLLGLTTTPGQLLAHFSLAGSSLARLVPTPEDYVWLGDSLLNDPPGGSLSLLAIVATALLVLGFSNLLRR